MVGKIIRVCLFFIALQVSAQPGNYFLSHYSPDGERFNIVCFDMVQDNRGVFYFATQAGILQFDGRNWDIIPTSGTVYSIAINDAGEIYAAGSRGFGKIERDAHGLETFTMLHEVQNAEYIFQIKIRSEKIYFLSDQNLFEYSLQSRKVNVTPASAQTGPFVSLKEIFDTLYLSTEQNGLFTLEGNRFAPARLDPIDKDALVIALTFNNRYLLVTDQNKVYLHEKNRLPQEILLQDSTYVDASVIVSATWVNANLVAIGTLRGGVIFVNPTTGSTEEIINFNTGLPDNEVFALTTDRNGNVWVAHAYGFTRISPSLPFRSFRYYPGLGGNLLCATTYNNKVYVGTTLGLYVLEKEDFYEEITYYVEIPIKSTVNVLRSTKKTRDEKKQEPEPEIETKDSQKGGFFRFLKRKKPIDKKDNKGNEATADDTDEEVFEEGTETVTNYRREPRKKKILRSSYYSYKKVEGIDAKISHLIHWRGKLIAGGLGGAHEVDGNKIIRITSNPIRFLFASERLGRVIAATYDDRLLQFGYENAWISKGSIENITEPVHYIFEEGDSAVWFCGFDKVFRVTNILTGQQSQRLDFTSSNFDKIIGVYVNNEVIIASPVGFFFYNRTSRQLEKGDTIRKPVAYFANASNLWFRDKHNWYTAGTSGGHNNLQLLNLFNNLRFIDNDRQTGSLWIITGNNELLQFNSEQVLQNEVVYPLILRAIRHDDMITARNYLKVEQDESAFIIEVVKPAYIGNRFVEYRYLLEGLHNTWSEWSTQNDEIRIPFLPAGEYFLKVQARDIFGRITEMDSVFLNIDPPYWKQPWFFAAEFSVFIFLVILSLRLSYRFLILSRLLSLLSIIMFIEFIQTIVGATFSQSSPVIDFGIQVFVAMLILPVEGFLRRYFLQALAKRNKARMREALEGKKKIPRYEPEDAEPLEIS